MIVLFGVHRAQDGELVSLPGGLRQEFANLDAGHVGSDWLKLAPDLAGGLRFHVEGVQVRATTALPNENAGIPLGSCTQYAPQRNPQSAQATATNHSAPAN